MSVSPGAMSSSSEALKETAIRLTDCDLLAILYVFSLGSRWIFEDIQYAGAGLMEIKCDASRDEITAGEVRAQRFAG